MRIALVCSKDYYGRMEQSIVRQLQAEALDPKTSVSDLLRKAKVVATKLELKDFLAWIEKELNGYNAMGKEDLPSYRIIQGETKAWNPYRGWIPIVASTPQWGDALSDRGVNQPVGELDDILKSDSNTLEMSYSSEGKMAIAKSIGMQTDIKFFMGRSSVAGILEGVRNTILDWSLKLEKEGILGEGLSFSQKEQEKALDPNVTYKIDHIDNFAGNIGNVSGSAKINVHQIHDGSKAEIQELIKQIRQYAPQINLDKSAKGELETEVALLEDEIKLPVPLPATVNGLLSSIKNIFEGVAGNVIAQGIVIAIQKFVAR
jgi:hypothetical protein